MIKVLDLVPELASALPETYALLRSSNLTVHACVSGVFLHGSRGLANRYRTNSDVDLSLVANIPPDRGPGNLDLLQTIFKTTHDSWTSHIELDLAVVFDSRQCQLKCFGQNTWSPQVCSIGGTDCFGLYKIGKGFNGLVVDAGIEVWRMYPCLKIWERA